MSAVATRLSWRVGGVCALHRATTDIDDARDELPPCSCGAAAAHTDLGSWGSMSDLARSIPRLRRFSFMGRSVTSLGCCCQLSDHRWGFVRAGAGGRLGVGGRFRMPYDLRGIFVEACDCNVVCPCWFDDEPGRWRVHRDAGSARRARRRRWSRCLGADGGEHLLPSRSPPQWSVAGCTIHRRECHGRAGAGAGRRVHGQEGRSARRVGSAHR